MANHKKTSGNKTRDWILRIVIFGALGVVLVLAVLDYQAKKHAGETATAWTDLMEAANADEDSVLEVKQLAESIAGSPERSETKDGGFNTELTYTWKSPFREYIVTVKAQSAEDDAVVESIQGPKVAGEE